MMPVMDGLQFLAERTNDELLAALPVIVMTAGPKTGVPASIQVLDKPLRMQRQLAELDRHCSCERPQKSQRSA